MYAKDALHLEIIWTWLKVLKCFFWAKYTVYISLDQRQQMTPERWDIYKTLLTDCLFAHVWQDAGKGAFSIASAWTSLGLSGHTAVTKLASISLNTADAAEHPQKLDQQLVYAGVIQLESLCFCRMVGQIVSLSDSCWSSVIHSFPPTWRWFDHSFLVNINKPIWWVCNKWPLTSFHCLTTRTFSRKVQHSFIP